MIGGLILIAEKEMLITQKLFFNKTTKNEYNMNHRLISQKSKDGAPKGGDAY